MNLLAFLTSPSIYQPVIIITNNQLKQVKLNGRNQIIYQQQVQGGKDINKQLYPWMC